MATHALIRLWDEKENYICGLYQHWDGYPSSAGKRLARALNLCSETNPYKLVLKILETYNEGSPPEVVGDDPNINMYQDWTYDVWMQTPSIQISVFCGKESRLTRVTLEEFAIWCKK